MRLNPRASHFLSDKVAQLTPGKILPRWKRGLACLAAMMCLAGSSQIGQAPGEQASPNPDRPYLRPEANRLPNVNDQMRMREQKIAKQNFDAINLVRKKQIAEDSNNLVTLAMALKAEVDSTTTKNLSPNALRKAEGIERLAHDVKQKMQLTMGAN
jgi:hypothetical protein